MAAVKRKRRKDNGRSMMQSSCLVIGRPRGNQGGKLGMQGRTFREK